MESLPYLVPFLFFVCVTGVMIARDPRRMRCAIMLALTIQVLLFEGLVLFTNLPVLQMQSTDLSARMLLAVLALMVLGVVVLAGLLVQSGVILLRKEGFRTAHTLSLFLGLLIFIYLVTGIFSALTNNVQLFIVLFLIGLPLLYLAFVLLAQLVYSALYGVWARRWARPAQVVVTLGAGLDGDRVTPLLAKRLDLGIRSFQRGVAAGMEPVFVVSGGQGANEEVAEAVAMRNYLLEKQIDQGSIIVEQESTTTEENLRYSAALLGPQAANERWLAVTSDYHAFRAALLMRKVGLRGNAIGARTPRYFWASAVLREYVALLRDHLLLNLTMLVLASAPMIVFVLAQLF